LLGNALQVTAVLVNKVVYSRCFTSAAVTNRLLSIHSMKHFPLLALQST